MTHALDIVRMQLLDRRLVLGTLGGVLLFVALGVGITAGEIATSGSFGKGFAVGIIGGAYGGVAGAQATSLSRLLPFAVAMGRTRRDYYLGTVLFVLLETLVLGALLLLFLGVEQVTGGWGGDVRFLGAGWEMVGNPVGQFLVFAAPLLLTFPMVLLGVVLHARWGLLGLVVGAVLAGAAAFAVVIATGLLTVGATIPVADTVRLVAIGAVFAVGGWFVVRRTPV
ncbi:hypothetical protein [Pseudonocardia abyssalis]|jgi:hypothetical protein|uniref:ABC transporter permease n=1 Tax=Pseudonocardia abyssalis TaxID=2792008 RepID=A0ABS6UWP8_9PSEU|nr:hypothetical protein [Pseudonocardia abyssalis]MBW0115504.1 hypothetical protein [Pseudonocardia abyssalis]MBW0136700.1 hypothetical protein [Pseudonocardia abyssalis]